MTNLEIFDPAMCCSTGVCGPGVDPTLPRFAADVEWLRSKGVEVKRYNLAQQVLAFTANPTVKNILHAKGTKCLPLILVNGAVVAEGSYPARRELARFAGVTYGQEANLPLKEQPLLVNISRGQPKAGR